MAGKILGSMDSRLWEILGWEQFENWNKKNNPPLPTRELKGVWDSIKRRHVEDNKTQWKNILEEKSKKGKAIVKCFADIQSVPINWLWPGRIAIGKLTMIAGDPGLGKSLVTADCGTKTVCT
jgi:predicted ATP-dependent serine protease